MKWIKNAIVDIIVSIVILIAAILDVEWLEVIVVAYTALMLFLKFLAVVSEQFIKSVKPGKSVEAPLWFTSSSYAFNVFVLLGFGWYYTAAQWVLIWLFSYLAFRKMRRERLKVRNKT